MEQKQTEKPQCAVRGLVAPGAMCRYVIVGGQLCGYRGECQHQVAQSTTQPADAEGAGPTT